MPPPICYSIDTSALINWWVEDYGPEVFPGLLPLMEGLIAEGRLRAARSVKDELGKGDLRTWCLTQTDLFLDEDQAIQLRVAQLMTAYQNPKKTRGIDKADPLRHRPGRGARTKLAGGVCRKRGKSYQESKYTYSVR